MRETAFNPRLHELTDQGMELWDYWTPTVFTDVQEEYEAIRGTAALMDFSMLRKAEIEGPGARDVVNAVVTRDLSSARPGQCRYSAVVDEDGMMLDDGTIFVRSGDRLRWCGANERTIELFAAEAAGTEVTVREMTDAVAHACLQGPKSRAILEGLVDVDLSNEAFPYYRFKEEVDVAGIPVFMPRLGYTGELGYELWAPAERAIELWDAVTAGGREHGMKLAGVDAILLVRLESGLVLPDLEYDSTTSPFECGLGFTVDLEAGDFHGRDALLRLKDAARVGLVSVEFERGGGELEGASVYAGGETVGRITSAIESPYRNGATLAFAKVRTDLTERGTELTVQLHGDPIGGRIVRHPVYDPDRTRVKS